MKVPRRASRVPYAQPPTRRATRDRGDDDREPRQAVLRVVEPVFTRAGGVAVVQGTRHPAAALLFCEWLLEEGREIIAEVGRDPTRRDLTATKGIRQRVIDVVALAEDEQECVDRYGRLLRLGSAQE
jgi:iron(III) transport system substrate-binding protein